MEDKIAYKLTGRNSIIDFSADAKHIIIGGYDGGFKVFDTTQSKICCKTKLKGSSNDVIIRHQDISINNKHVAFSALGKVFVMDILKKEIIWEYEYSKAERVMTVSFCFFNQSSRLVIPDGDSLLIYDIENRKSYNIALPDGAGWTDCIAVSPNDSHIAYKSCNDSYDIRLDRNGIITSKSNEYKEDMSDKIFIYDIVAGKCLNVINVPYPPIQAMQIAISGQMKFIDDETILINRKTIGFSCFNIKSGNETSSINWKKKGFEFGIFKEAKIYANGRFVLFNNATPDSKTIKYKGNIAIEYTIPIPEGLEYILYDTKEDKIIYQQKNGESPAAFHSETKQFAYLKREWDENYKCTDYLCIRKIEN
jgi:WD40 repeat protein